MSESDQSEMEKDTIDLNSVEMEAVQSDSYSYSDSDSSISRFLNIRPPESKKKLCENCMKKEEIVKSLHFDWDATLEKSRECYS